MGAREKKVQEPVRAEPEGRTPGAGVPGRDLLRFAGIWTAEEADEVRRAIEEECEKVDPDAW